MTLVTWQSVSRAPISLAAVMCANPYSAFASSGQKHVRTLKALFVHDEEFAVSISRKDAEEEVRNHFASMAKQAHEQPR